MSDVPLSVENTNAEAMATQALLQGLFLSLVATGGRDHVERAFAFAEDAATAHAYNDAVAGAASQGTIMITIIAQLRKMVLGKP